MIKSNPLNVSGSFTGKKISKSPNQLFLTIKRGVFNFEEITLYL